MSTTAMRLIQAQNKDLGGFQVRRCLPLKGCKQVGPWVFFDHMGPAQFAAGQGVDVRPHPHIGLATVTYLLAGEMLHRDSLGTEQLIKPGEINLMVAGRGIVHSERQRQEVKAAPHSLHGLQLWLALPTEQEQCPPAFYHYGAAELPLLAEPGRLIKVLIGQAYGMHSPVKTFTETLYLEVQLAAQQELTLPDAEELALYVLQGGVKIGDVQVPQHCMAVLTPQQRARLYAEQDSLLVLLGGAALARRYLDWNFVASDPALLQQAKQDWQNGRFAKVPGDEEEFIPYPS